jgi:hypothetical protein
MKFYCWKRFAHGVLKICSWLVIIVVIKKTKETIEYE